MPATIQRFDPIVGQQSERKYQHNQSHRTDPRPLISDRRVVPPGILRHGSAQAKKNCLIKAETHQHHRQALITVRGRGQPRRMPAERSRKKRNRQGKEPDPRQDRDARQQKRPKSDRPLATGHAMDQGEDQAPDRRRQDGEHDKSIRDRKITGIDPEQTDCRQPGDNRCPTR